MYFACFVPVHTAAAESKSPDGEIRKLIKIRQETSNPFNRSPDESNAASASPLWSIKLPHNASTESHRPVPGIIYSLPQVRHWLRCFLGDSTKVGHDVKAKGRNLEMASARYFSFQNSIPVNKLKWTVCSLKQRDVQKFLLPEQNAPKSCVPREQLLWCFCIYPLSGFTCHLPVFDVQLFCDMKKPT